MSVEADRREDQTLRDYLHVLGRRKWTILAVVLIAAGVAYAISSRQQHEYRADAKILLTRQDLLATVTGAQDQTGGVQPDRLVQTLSDLARLPIVAQRALSAAGVRSMTPDQLLKSSSVAPKPDADVIDFVVMSPDPGLAKRLATAYATEFRSYRHELDTMSLNQAQANVERRLHALAQNNQRQTALYANLITKSEELQTLEALQNSNEDVVHPSDAAVKIRPRPVRDAMLAGILGLLIGTALAFLAEALEPRVRTVDEIRDRLGLPILAQIPKPARSARKNGLAMLTDGQSFHVEPFRILRTNFDLVNLERHAKTIMVASADDEEGKSTTIANFAVALARTGRSVAVVDCDLRRPTLHRLFRLEPSPGLTDVLLGHATLDEALRSVAITDGSHVRDAESTNGSASVKGFVNVLVGGPSPVDHELVGGEAVGRVLRELEARFDCVLVDAPPLLLFGDALALSARLDAMILVVRLKTARRQGLTELERVLAASPAKLLGVVATGVAGAELGYYGRYAKQRPESSRAGTAANP